MWQFVLQVLKLNATSKATLENKRFLDVPRCALQLSLF